MAKSFNLTAQINLQAPTNLRPVVAKIKREFSNISADVKLNVDSKSAKTVDLITNRLKNMNGILVQARQNTDSLNAALRNLSNSLGSVKSAGQTTSDSIGKTAANAQKVAKNVQVARTELEEFGRQGALAIRRFAAFRVVTTSVFALTNAITSGFKAFVDFDRELVKLQQVTGKGAIGIRDLEQTITRLATSLGVSSESLMSVASTLAQAGLSATETKIALTALAKTELAPSFDNLTDTTEGAIAVLRQFGLQAKDLESVLGSINAVAAAFAVESRDIITAIQRTGGVFASASKGVSEGKDALNEFIAVFTSVRATTRESAETIATGLRTIFTRIQRSTTIDLLKEYGVQLRDLEGKFVGPFEAVKRLSASLSTLDPRSAGFAKIVEELGGFRQIGKVIPLIQQFATAQQALGIAQKGQSSLTDAQITAQKSLANQIAKVREQFLALVRDVGQSNTFQALFKIVTGLASGLISLASAFKPILPILAIFGAVKGISAIGQFGTGFIGGLRKGGGSKGAGDNIGSSLSGAKEKERAEATSRASDAIRLNTDAIKTLTAAVGSLENTIRSKPSSSLSGGGKVLGFSRGGTVPGSGRGDKVPAMLEPGEFVMNKSAVRSIGGNNLQRLNSGGLTKKIPIKTLTSRSDNGPNIKSFQKQSENFIEDDDTVEANIRKRTFEDYGFEYKDYDIITSRLQEQGIKFPIGSKKGSSRGKFDARSGPIMEDLLREKMGKGAKKYEGVAGYSDISNAPIDIIKGKSIYEVKFKSGLTSDNEILGKLLRYKLENSPYKSVGFQENKKNKKSIDDINLGSINLINGSDLEGMNGYKSDYIAYLKEQKKYKLARGGKIQKFINGGVAQRKVGYIDYDVIANADNETVVKQGMEATGMSGPRLYTDYLTQLAVKARKNSNLEKLRAIYGVAGSGKTTLARGQNTDNARLRQTERFPILSPEDIQKATEIIVLSSSVSGKKLDEFFKDTDRTYTLSSTSQSEKDTIKNQRINRDITGVGLENRKPGTTSNVETDTAISEALLTDRLGKKSVILGRTQTGKLRRKRGDELVEIIKKKIGVSWGGFSPMTLGHESIMDSASAMGITPEDFLYLIGSNEGIKSGDASSYRTAIFDQDARVLLAKAGAGARGATVLPKRGGFEIPLGFDISDPNSNRRKILLPGSGSTAFIGDEKSQDIIDKYAEAGYGVKSLGRMGGISGTMVRDLIAQGNLGELQKVLSPGVYELISNNIGRIQNRANILPSIIEQVQKNQTLKLGDVEKQIKAIGISRIDQKKMDDPEYAAKVEALLELRSYRDKIKSQGSFEPYKLLDELARSQPDKYSLDFNSSGASVAQPIRTITGKKPQGVSIGGLIQKFMAGGVAEASEVMTLEDAKKKSRKEIMEILASRPGGISTTEKAAKVGSGEVYKILGQRNLDAATESLKEAILKEYVKTYNRQAGAAQGQTTRLENKGLEFGAAGIFGSASTPSTIDIVSDKLSRSAKVRVLSGVMDKNKADQLDALFVQGTEDLAQKAASIVSGTLPTGKTISNPNAEASIQGGLLEKVVQLLGGPGKTQGQGMDFPDGLQGAAKYFGLPDDIPTDLKRTLSGPSTIKDNIVTYLKNVMGYASGGKVDYYSLEKNSGFSPREFNELAYFAKTNDFSLQEFKEYIAKRLREKQAKAGLMMNPAQLLRAITPEPAVTTDAQRALAESLKGPVDAKYNPKYDNAVSRFAGGGTVPAMVSNGETYVSPQAAKKIGYAKLNKMNMADRNGMTGFAGGGMSIIKGAGSGTSDSIGPVNLPVGSFIIRERATKALGFNKGGNVGIQKFVGGSPGGVSSGGGSINLTPGLDKKPFGLLGTAAIKLANSFKSSDAILNETIDIFEKSIIKGTDLGFAVNDYVNVLNDAGKATIDQINLIVKSYTAAGEGLANSGASFEEQDAVVNKWVAALKEATKGIEATVWPLSSQEDNLSSPATTAATTAATKPKVTSTGGSPPPEDPDPTDWDAVGKILFGPPSSSSPNDSGNFSKKFELTPEMAARTKQIQQETTQKYSKQYKAAPSIGVQGGDLAKEQVKLVAQAEYETAAMKEMVDSLKLSADQRDEIVKLQKDITAKYDDEYKAASDSANKAAIKAKAQIEFTTQTREMVFGTNKPTAPKQETLPTGGGGGGGPFDFTNSDAAKESFADEEFIKYRASQTGTSESGVKLELAQKLGRATYESENLFGGKVSEAKTGLVTRRESAMKIGSSIEQAKQAMDKAKTSGPGGKVDEEALKAATQQLADANSRLSQETEGVLQQMIELRPDLAGTAKGMEALQKEAGKVAAELSGGDLAKAQEIMGAAVAGNEKGGKLSKTEAEAIAR
ncbi:phage tail tape measure protein, partial [bacterium]|nr:phage tail tape measure protein [bacterium]